MHDFAVTSARFLSVGVARAIVGQVIAPLVADMEMVDEATWVKPLSADHRAVITLANYRTWLDLMYGSPVTGFLIKWVMAFGGTAPVNQDSICRSTTSP